jgi:vanillate O-demethylase ferredoxin subunit
MSAATSLTVRVSRKRREALDICSFELVRCDGSDLPAFSAGSHIDVQLPGGFVRPYSLCNEPAETHRYMIAVLRVPASRGGSRAAHDLVNEGDELQISAPKNHFPLAHGVRHSLLLAGGIGVTPILCMVERLAATGASFGMHYVTRSRERTAFIERIQASGFARQVAFHFDDGAPDQSLNLAHVLARPAVGAHLYVCGPKGFMDAALSIARRQGWPDSQLHWECFAGIEATPRSSDEAFEVQLASSGRVIRIAPETTVTQALAEAGIGVPVSCEQGVCGTCLTRVLQGEPDHRDCYLSAEEQAANDQFTPCCSRSKSARLVLDL